MDYVPISRKRSPQTILTFNTEGIMRFRLCEGAVDQHVVFSCHKSKYK